MYNIFLDDMRSTPKYGNYNTARSYDSCISLLMIFGDELEKISLDYDLGTLNETGYDVLVYMKEHGIKPKYINIHSDHPEGARMMVKYANENFPKSIVTNQMTDGK